MERRIKLTIGCKEAIKKLHIEAQRSLKSAIKRIARGEIMGKHLKENLEGFSSIKDGNYRAIYRIVNGEVIVFDVGHRSVIYNKVKSNIEEDLGSI